MKARPRCLLPVFSMLVLSAGVPGACNVSAPGRPALKEASPGSVKVPAWAKVSREQIAAAERLGLPVAIENSIGMRLVLIPPGEFRMGSAEGDPMRMSDETRHRVRITKPFYMGIYEVTQEQYEAVIRENPSYRRQARGPVEQVSARDIETKFLPKLSEKEARTYRLPTEAQWEYACRAGSKTRYCFGDDPDKLGEYAWYKANSGGSSHPVGRKRPNAWGLYDVHGNVWEWTSCFLVPYGREARTDPVGAKEKSRHRRERVIRGGAFCYEPKHLRASHRYRDGTTHRHDIIGFRVIAEADSPRYRGTSAVHRGGSGGRRLSGHHMACLGLSLAENRLVRVSKCQPAVPSPRPAVPASTLTSDLRLNGLVGNRCR